jgi:hypothetical protein
MPHKDPDYHKKYREANKAKASAYQKEYEKKNKEKLTAYRKEYYKKNKTKLAKQHKNYYEQNKEELVIPRREYAKSYAKNNKGKVNSNTVKRRAAKLQRTPAWLDATDYFEMECIYLYCAALRSCGLDYHVDHFYPLQGKEVSGLHAPSNLQVIHAEENRSKSNSYTP